MLLLRDYNFSNLTCKLGTWHCSFASRGVRGGGGGRGAASPKGGDNWVPVGLHNFSGFLPINEALT